ncbi:VOC family protein [Facklamia lactis]|uniref:VOC family protein n=1 Tax=Facklamia lactis TaxID=2749967 RepID=UPI0018CD239B|nr:VOC family protein [Facklamia lactis]MBG9979412.1 VOC family protein [Facklamia lactis]
MKRLDVTLNFSGQAEEAFEFYSKLFGKEVSDLYRVKDMPNYQEAFAEEIHELVAWQAIEFEHFMLNGGDFEAIGLNRIETAERQSDALPRTFLSLAMDSKQEADRVFNQLAEGGTVFIPLAEQDYSPYFGRLMDRYGIGWETFLDE